MQVVDDLLDISATTEELVRSFKRRVLCSFRASLLEGRPLLVSAQAENTEWAWEFYLLLTTSMLMGAGENCRKGYGK